MDDIERTQRKMSDIEGKSERKNIVFVQSIFELPHSHGLLTKIEENARYCCVNKRKVLDLLKKAQNLKCLSKLPYSYR